MLVSVCHMNIIFNDIIGTCILFNLNVFCSVWVARRPPGYAFIDFDDRRDAQDAIRELDGEQLKLFIAYVRELLTFVPLYF